MTHLLVLALAMALLADPVPPGPTDEWCGKAPSQPVAVDTDICSFEGATIRISLMSETGCWEDLDSTLTFERAGKIAEVQWPGDHPNSRWLLDPADSKSHKWKIGTICRKSDAVAVDEDRLLFFLRKEGRPNADRLVAVLYDVQKGKLVDFVDVGPAGDLVAREARALWFRQGEWGQVGGCLICSSKDELALPDGDRLVKAQDTELDLNPVTRVWVSAGKIQAEPDFQKTLPPLKKYFPDAKTLEAAARRNADYKHLLIREAKTATGRTCVQVYGWKTKGKWRSLPWYCEAR